VTASAALVLALTAVVAAVDWLAVGARNRRLEYVAKPLTTVGLIAVAVVINPADPPARVLFVVALVFSLGGDVLLMLPARERLFPFGLASFLVAHLAYIPGLVLLGAATGGMSGTWLVVGLLVAAVGVATVGRHVLGGVQRNASALMGAVTVYLTVILAMLVAAFGTVRPLAIVGAALFCISDSVLASNEFVRARKGAHLVVMVTYHLAQALLVLSLINW